MVLDMSEMNQSGTAGRFLDPIIIQRKKQRDFALCKVHEGKRDQFANDEEESYSKPWVAMNIDRAIVQ